MLNLSLILGYIFQRVRNSLTLQARPVNELLSYWIMPQHIGARTFEQKSRVWEKQDLHLYFLPPYSPELNKIEILWRKMKYEWMPFDASQSFQQLKNRLNETIQNIGYKYTIKFE